jgi:AcrR family transcriptional regulator
MKSSLAAARAPAEGQALAAAQAEQQAAAQAQAAHRAPASAVSRRRPRNARGQGGRLTQDIVSGALALIEREGSDEAVTLRAVAREIGIAAPSIYAHFPDRDAIVMAAVVKIFDELTAAIERGVSSADQDPAARLVAGCEAYVAFGLEHPARYGVLFSERRIAAADNCTPVPIGPDGRPVLEFGAEAFALLVSAIDACVRSGASASTDVLADGTALWVAMHGTISLRTALRRFPWPDAGQFVRELVLSLAKVSAGKESSATAPA